MEGTQVSTEQATQPGKNGGILNVGGTHNPTGLGGRPTNEARRKASENFEKWMDRIGEKTDDQDLDDAAIARYADICGKYGPGSKIDVSSEVPAILASAAHRILMPELTPLLGEERAKALCVRLFEDVEGHLGSYRE